MSRQFSSFLLDIEHAPEAFIQAHLGNPEPCKALWAAADGYKHDGKFDVGYQTTLDDVFTMLNNDYVNTRSFSVGDVLVEWVWYQWPADESEPDPIAYLLTSTGWLPLPWTEPRH
jgi:hypothetical protein